MMATNPTKHVVTIVTKIWLARKSISRQSTNSVRGDTIASAHDTEPVGVAQGCRVVEGSSDDDAASAKEPIGQGDIALVLWSACLFVSILRYVQDKLDHAWSQIVRVFTCPCTTLDVNLILIRGK